MRRQSARLDRRFVEFIEEHIDLLLALTSVGIGVWAALSSEYAYIPALAVAGGISFFIGFIASLGVSAILEVAFVVQQAQVHQALPTAVIMVEGFGYGCVAWLGYRHREQQRRQKEISASTGHRDSVMPWVVANEVRTSLAAIRFLLFPLNNSARDDSQHDSLRQATDELQRLEQLFSNIEKSSESHSPRARNL